MISVPVPEPCPAPHDSVPWLSATARAVWPSTEWALPLRSVTVPEHGPVAVASTRPSWGWLVMAGSKRTVPDIWQLPAKVFASAARRAPERDVSPNATIDPDPSICGGASEGSGVSGGPRPVATYTAPPTTERPPNVGVFNGVLPRMSPVAASRAVRKPAGSAV